MRQIKFRIWDSTHKNFLFFGGIFNSSFIWDHLAGETCQQYIGLRDKNRKEIYEGDLINFSRKVELDETWEYKNQEVSYDNECASFVFGKEMLCMLDRVVYESLEIVGNVFENPELL